MMVSGIAHENGYNSIMLSVSFLRLGRLKMGSTVDALANACDFVAAGGSKALKACGTCVVVTTLAIGPGGTEFWIPITLRKEEDSHEMPSESAPPAWEVIENNLATANTTSTVGSFWGF